MPGPLDGRTLDVTLANSGYSEVILDGVSLACTQMASADSFDRMVKCIPADAGIAPFVVDLGAPCDDGGVGIDVLLELDGCFEHYVGTY